VASLNGSMVILSDLDMDLPEKIGGWSQLTNSNNTLPGAARSQHTFTSLAGEKYAAIGTSQGLFFIMWVNFMTSLH
jgi:hypothetical protein